MTLGEKLRKLRKQKGLTQADMEEASGISIRTIQRIEKGASKPRPYTLKTLADALDVKMEQLMESNPIDSNRKEQELKILQRINLVAIIHIILPLSNVLLPLLIWVRKKNLPLVNKVGKKIIAFQLLWTLVTLFVIFFTPIISFLIYGQAQDGQFPLILFIYLLLVLFNLLMIFHSTINLSKNRSDIYAFVPNFI